MASSRPFQATSEELFGLSAALGLPAPGFLRSEATEAWTDEIRQEVERLGLRNLMARDLIRFEGEQAVIPKTIANLADTICHPALLARIWTSRQDHHQLVDFHATPRWASGHRLTRVGNHALTLFPSEHLLETILASTELPDDARQGKRQAVLQRSVIDRFLATVSPQNPAAARDKASPDDEILRALAATGSQAGMLMVVYPQDPETLTGSTVTWALTSDHELYEVARVDDDSPDTSDIELTPSTRDEMYRRFRDALPSSQVHRATPPA